MNRTLSSAIPFVEAKHTLGKQKPVAIELRSSFTTSAEGAALGLAKYWHSSISLKHPSHYVVDESAVYQCIPDDVIAPSYAGNKKGVLLITLCSEPLTNVTQWNDYAHQQVLEKTLNLVRELANKHHIPLKYIDDLQKKHWYEFKRPSGVFVNITGVWPPILLLGV